MRTFSLRRVAVAGVALFLTACGDDEAPLTLAPGDPLLLSVSAAPGGAVLWAWNDGAPTATPAALPLNAALVFEFAGAVAAVPTTSPITVVGAPAPFGVAPPPGPLAPAGAFTIEDAPGLGAGNRRRLVFRPQFDSTAGSSACAAGGYASATEFAVFFDVGSLVVAGEPLENSVTASFTTLACGTGAYGDFVDGPPFVVAASPALSEPVGAPIAASSITENRVLLTLGERVDPSSAANPLLVRDVVSGASVPGSSALVPPDPSESPPRSRLAFFATAPFAPGRTYEALIAPGVVDYGGHAVQSSPLNSSGPDGVYGTGDDGPARRLLFAVAATPTTQQTTVESFDDTSRLASTAGFAAWSGDGAVRVGGGGETFGDGSDGPFSATTGTVPLDTNQTITVGGVPQSRKGVWNFTSFTVAAGATVRLHGPYPAHLRVLGATTIAGTVTVNAGATPPAAAGSAPPYEYGPANGLLDDGGASGTAIVFGGVGNAGGGAGGNASEVNTDGSPAGYCPATTTGLHAYFGSPGSGPYIDGLPTFAGDPSYSGGGGGRSGLIPASFPAQLGGWGGAGGTGATAGEPGLPRLSSGCEPSTTPLCPPGAGPGGGLPLNVATAPLPTPHFIPPLGVQRGGGGGGAGGDKMQTLSPPTFDDQGGGGGGGGGTLRISALGTLGVAATALISANGAAGGIGAQANLTGDGGSGAGGQVWLQTFGGAAIDAGSLVEVIGRARPGGTTAAGCGSHSSGGGGQGVMQIEAPTPVMPPTISPGAVVQTLINPSTSAADGEVVSTFVDTGAFAPDYLAATVASDLGPIAAAALLVSFEGAHALQDGTGPDLTTLKSSDGGAPITAANISALDGYRYFRFRIAGSTPLQPGVAPAAPNQRVTVDEIVVQYATP
jgi:hypothetical protein